MKKLFIGIFFILLIYTRFVGLDWGLPYPMHPDERNMANAIQQLSCTGLQDPNCFNPHFFAYGQFPLYLAYILIMFCHVAKGIVSSPITFDEATLSLRFIAAFSSVLTTLVMVGMIQLLAKKTLGQFKYLLFLLIFSPALIQFAHYGTTESLLMFFYISIIYFSLKFILQKTSLHTYVLTTGIISGFALATKISAALFLILPILVIFWYCLRVHEEKKLLTFIFKSAQFVTVAFVLFIIFSPYNFIELKDFLGSMAYESDIGVGRYVAFYTRQFVKTLPLLFQFKAIFPFALGMPIFLFSLGGFFVLPWKKEYNLLRIAFILYFLPNGIFFAKWTRFLAPIFPILILIALLFIARLMQLIHSYIKHSSYHLIGIIITIFCVLPGVAYLSIYQQPDIRFTASQWIFENVPANSKILAETANVVDVPLVPPHYTVEPLVYQYISFNHYDVDENLLLDSQLQELVSSADYIIVPSRRVFWNHTCLKPHDISEPKRYEELLEGYAADRCEHLQKTYPKLHNYYEKLFSGELGFQQVAEFSQYPSISLFGKTIITFPDESAEETWTVFDHPVIRVYKKIH